MDLFGDFTGLYFYSAVVQGNMALLGLAALFAVFRLQILYSLRQETNDKILAFVEARFQRVNGMPEWLHAHAWNANQLVHALKTFKGGEEHPEQEVALIKEVLDDNRLNHMLLEKSVLELFQKEVTKGLRLPIFMTVAVIVVSLLLLPISAAVHRAGFAIEAEAFAGTIVLNVLAIVTNLRFVMRSLSHGHPVLG